MSELRTIWHAAKAGNLTLLKQLIEEGNECFHKHDFHHKTAYHYGCFFGHPRIVQYLLTLYEKNNLKIPPLELEVALRGCEHIQLRKFLKGEQTIEETVRIDDEDRRLEALPLWDVAKEGQHAKLRELLRYCPNYQLTAKDMEGHTVLYYACKFDHPATVAVLLPKFKIAMGGDWEMELAKCRQITTCKVVCQVLNGDMTMKEVFNFVRKQPPRGMVAYTPSVPAPIAPS